MNLVEYSLDGKQYHLLLNGTALFNFYDRYGHEKTMLDILGQDDREGFECSLWLLAELSLQGEMYRRYQGMDKGEYLLPARAASAVCPVDLPGLKLALARAIRAGFTRRHPSEGDVDPWLAEIEKKKKDSPVRSMLTQLQKALGLVSERA